MKETTWIRWLILCFGILVLVGCARNPATRELEISTMSRSEEVRQGRELYPIMTQLHDGVLKGEALQNYVSRVGHQIADVSHRPDLPYSFNVVNSSMPNAYALPGGYISVTRGLLLEMDREGELAAVLAHEIAHAAARHAARRETGTIFANLLSSLNVLQVNVGGYRVLGLYEDLSRLGARAILASYSREQEREADRLGIRYMARAGYDPRGMVALQEMMLRLRRDRPGYVEQLFSSHPLTEQRITYSRRAIESIREETEIPEDRSLNRFGRVVRRTWVPRKPAYKDLETGIRYLGKNRVSKAIDHFKRARDRYDGEALFHAWLGQAYQVNGDTDQARRSLDRALELHPAVFRIQLYSGVNHFALKQYRNSLENLRKAERLLPGFPPVIFFRGRNHEELDHRERAARYYQQYLNKVDEGKRARYCTRRLREWGYL